MKKHREVSSKAVVAFSLALAVTCGVSACAPGAPAGSNGSASGSAPVEQPAGKPEKKTESQLAAEAYKKVLASPLDHFELEDAQVASAMFSYALVNMTPDEFPQLLVRASGDAETWYGVEDIRVFTYDSEEDVAVAPEGAMNAGAAAAGGFRGGVSSSAYGNGLILDQLSSGTGIGEFSRVTIEDGVMVQRYVAPIDMSQGQLAASALVGNETRDIAWLDAADTSALDALEQGEWTSTVEATPDMSALAQEAGLATFTGTLRIMSADAVCELQGEQNLTPGYEDPNGYAILDLGGEVELTLNSGGGGQFTHTTRILALNQDRPAETWRAYDGMQVTIAIDPAVMFWPSDASVPIGAPRCRDNFAIL